MVEPLDEQCHELLDDQTHTFHLSGAAALVVGQLPALSIGMRFLPLGLLCRDDGGGTEMSIRRIGLIH